MNTVTSADVLKVLDSKVSSTHGAWNRAVLAYARELVDNIPDSVRVSPDAVSETLLLGASSWREFNSNGCSLIYDYDIAERCCSPSEFKRSRGGRRAPNKGETWLDVQARALYQASLLVGEVVNLLSD